MASRSFWLWGVWAELAQGRRYFLQIADVQMGNGSTLSPLKFLNLGSWHYCKCSLRKESKSQVNLLRPDFSWIPAAALPWSAEVLFCCLMPQRAATKPASRVCPPVPVACPGSIFSACLWSFSSSFSFQRSTPQKGSSLYVNGIGCKRFKITYSYASNAFLEEHEAENDWDMCVQHFSCWATCFLLLPLSIRIQFQIRYLGRWLT